MRSANLTVAIVAVAAALAVAPGAMAVTGTSRSADAALAEYDATCVPRPEDPCNRVKPDEEGGGPGAVQTLEQNGALPFTGLLAVPVVLIGLLALAGGVALRRRVDDAR